MVSNRTETHPLRLHRNVPCIRQLVGLFWPAVNKDMPPLEILEGKCAGTEACPLSCIKAGTEVCIKELSASPEIQARLREMGLGEAQRIKLLSRDSSIICQVCNARLGLSRQLAEAILVEPIPPKPAVS
jgi:Fe2+ transport system protein FeoA